MKFCQNCGKELNENAKFCDGCGKEVVAVENTTATTDASVQEEKVEVIDVDSVVGDSREYSEEILSVTPEATSAPKTEVETVATPEVQPVQNTVQPEVQNVQQQVENNAPVNTAAQVPIAEKKSNGLLVGIIVFLVIVVIGLAVLIGIKVFSGDKQDTGGLGSDDNDIVDVDTNDDDDTVVDSTGTNNNNNNNNGSGNTSASTTYDYKGYTFTIPTGYRLTENSGYFELLNNTDKVQMVVEVMQYTSYSSIVTSTEEIKSEMADEGVTVSSILEETVGSSKSVIINASKDGKKITYVITAINEYDTLMTAYVNYGTKTDSEIKLVAANLAKNAVAKSSSFASEKVKDYQKGQIKVPSFSLEK